MADNQGQTIAAPVTNPPAPPQNQAQQTTPMWASPQLGRPGQEAAPTSGTGSNAAAGPVQQPLTPVVPAGAPASPPSGQQSGQQSVQQYPYGASNPPPMTFEVPQEQLNAGGPGAPVAGGGRRGRFVERMKTPVAAAVIGGVLLLGVGFAAGYVVGHDVGSSSVSSTTDGQTGFGGTGGFGGQMPGGSTGQGQLGQGGTGTSPFGQGQSQSQPFGQSQDGTGDGTTGDGSTTDGSTTDDTDLSQTQ